MGDNDSERDIIRHMIDNDSFFQPIKALNQHSVDEFVNSFKRVHFEKGDVVCRQKEVGTDVYVIESGKFDIYTTRRKQDGKTIEEFLVATIGGGIGFGMMEFQYDTTRLGTVKVSDDSEEATCWVVDGEALATFVQSNELLSKRLRVNRILYKTLADTSLLNNIDEPNIKAELIDTFVEERVAPGTNIINQGAEVNDDSKLYVLLDGEADAYVEKPFSPTIHSASYKTGDNFGDMSFMYDCPREATVVASSPCTLLTLKKSQFQSLAAKGSTTLQNIFNKHALHRSKFKFGAADEMYMSSGHFVDALHEFAMGNDQMDAAYWKEKLVLISELADRTSRGDLIPFTEFVKRAALMNRDHPEVEIAFRLFDENGKGTVSTQMFRDVMIDLLKPDECPFDILSAVSTEFFSKEEEMDQSEFREWLQAKEVNGKKDWKNSKKVRKLIDGIHAAYAETSDRFRRIGTEDSMNEDALMTVRSNPGGISEFPVPYLCAGAVAGMVSRTLVHPLTRMKILRQTGILQNYKNFGSVLKLNNMFQGNAANMMRIVPQMGLQFGIYEYLTQSQLEASSSPVLGLPQRFMAGGIAGLTALSLTYPLDVARARMTVMAGRQKEFNYSTVETLLKMIKKSGPTSFYKGYTPAALSVFPFVATEFSTYEFSKSVLGLSPLIGGAVAGATASAVCYPLETVRRRLQVQGFAKNQTYNYSGFMNGISSMLAKEGVGGLYRGFIPNLARVAPAVSFSFATYEVALDYFRDMWEDHRFERNYHYPHVEGGH